MFVNRTLTIGGIGALVLGGAGLILALGNQGALRKVSTEFENEIAALSRTTKGLNEEIRMMGSAVGFVIEFENGTTLYLSGDSGISSEMEIINDIYNPYAAFLAIGGVYTMGQEEAAYAAQLVNPQKFVVPYHYKSFPFIGSDDSIFVERIKAAKAQGRMTADPLVFTEDEEKEIGGVKVRWLAHAAFLFTSPEGKKILLDPSESVPTLPEKYKQDWKNLGGLDLVLITHGHFDHAHVPTLRKLSEAFPQAVILTSFELANYLTPLIGIPVIAANPDSAFTKKIFKQSAGIDVNMGSIKVHLVPANHSSSVFGSEGIVPF